MPPWNPNDYETVDSRIHRFYEAFPTGRILTELVSTSEKDGRTAQYVVKATVYRTEDGVPAATGYAEEVVGSSVVNKTSALENAETSAVGRALANLGLSPKGARPSLEEMEKAERVKAAPKKKPTRAELDERFRLINAADTLETLDAVSTEVAASFDLSTTDRDALRAAYIKRKNYLSEPTNV